MSSGAATSNKLRGVFGGGSGRNDINYITIATTGNFSDFGDFGSARTGFGATSAAHGGIA